METTAVMDVAQLDNCHIKLQAITSVVKAGSSSNLRKPYTAADRGLSRPQGAKRPGVV